MSEDTITAEAIIDTDFQSKVALKSPYEARHVISNLPWQEYGEEVEEYGSLKEKAEARGTNTKTSELIDVFDAYETYGFSDEFACHQKWDTEALGPDTGAWLIDENSWDEAADFFQFAGYSVEVADDVNL